MQEEEAEEEQTTYCTSFGISCNALLSNSQQNSTSYIGKLNVRII